MKFIPKMDSSHVRLIAWACDCDCGDSNLRGTVNAIITLDVPRADAKRVAREYEFDGSGLLEEEAKRYGYASATGHGVTMLYPSGARRYVKDTATE